MRFFPFLRSSSRRDENGANGKGAASANELLERAAFLQAEAILAELKLSRDGLTDDEAARRREQYGLNQVAHEKPPTWYAELGRAFANPFNFLLTVLAVVSALTGDDRATFVIGFMVVLSTGLRFVQEFRSNTAAQGLQALVRTTATVGRADDAYVRDATPATHRREIPIAELVPGDIVYLSAGDMIPADLRVLSAKDLFVGQSSLTGEAMPVEKSDQAEKPASPVGVTELPTICFMGTSVVSGTPGPGQ